MYRKNGTALDITFYETQEPSPCFKRLLYACDHFQEVAEQFPVAGLAVAVHGLAILIPLHFLPGRCGVCIVKIDVFSFSDN